MNFKSRIVSAVILVLAFVLPVVSPAHAVSLVQTQLYSASSTYPPDSRIDTVDLEFSLFDSSLGNLTQVDLSYALAGQWSGVILNNRFRFAFGAYPHYIIGVDVPNTTFGDTFEVNVDPVGVIFNGTIGQQKPFAGSQVDNFSASLFSNLAPFIGSGTFSIPVQAILGGYVDDDVLVSGSFVGNGSMSLTYHYEPTGSAVPEPASLMLLLMGGAGALGAKRLREKFR